MNRLTSASAVLAIVTSLFVTVPAKAKVVIDIPSDPKVHEKMKLLKEKKEAAQKAKASKKDKK